MTSVHTVAHDNNSSIWCSRIKRISCVTSSGTVFRSQEHLYLVKSSMGALQKMCFRKSNNFRT